MAVSETQRLRGTLKQEIDIEDLIDPDFPADPQLEE